MYLIPSDDIYLKKLGMFNSDEFIHDPERKVKVPFIGNELSEK